MLALQLRDWSLVSKSRYFSYFPKFTFQRVVGVTETRDLSNAVNMAGPVEARFDAAVNVVRSMPKKGIKNLFESKRWKGVNEVFQKLFFFIF